MCLRSSAKNPADLNKHPAQWPSAPFQLAEPIRTAQKNAPNLRGVSLSSDYSQKSLRLHRRRFRCPRWIRRTGLPHLEPRKPPDRNVFAQLGNRLGDHLADRVRLVLDEVLLIQAALLIALFHLALHDLLDHRFRLARCSRLCGINLALFLEHLGRHIFAPHVARIYCRDVHGHIVTQLLERIGARHEIAFTIDLHDHADLSPGMNVVANQPFGRFARRFLRRRGLAPLAQNVNGLGQVSAGLHQRGAAIAEPCVGPLSQFLHKLGWNFHNWFCCTHPFLSGFSLPFLNFSACCLQKWPGVKSLHSAGPVVSSVLARSFSGFPRREEPSLRPGWPALRCRPRNRLPAFHTARTCWYPRFPRHPALGPRPLSGPPPAIARIACGLRRPNPQSLW